MIVVTTNEVPGRDIVQVLGVVRGIIVRSPSIGQGILGGLKSIVGGNNLTYTQVCEQARMDAFAIMIRHAEEKGANAIVGMRYDATEFAPGATEVLAYGTAVKIAA